MNAWRAPARRILSAAALVLLALTAVPAFARAADSGAPVPEAHGYVNDVAGVIGDARAAQLESYLDELEKKTGVQFAILTVPTTNGEAPESYKVRVFQAWGIGGKGKDEGLLLLVALQEHRMIFETGYGLEGTLPDGWEAGMLRDLAAPRMREGNTPDAITAAVLACGGRIAKDKGVTVEWTGDALRYGGGRRSVPERFPAGLVAFVLFLLISGLRRLLWPGRAGYWGGGPWLGGGMGGWGGGFGGGGGGNTFGGFGGGGSGGGGGGTSW